MSKVDKLIDRLGTRPKDFSWKELVKLLNHFGYSQVKTGKTGGSRVRFIHDTHPPISLHRPHPSPYLKRYQLEDIVQLLIQERLI